MLYTQLGRTGLKVSRFCLGTMNFGSRTTPEDSFTIMDRALDLGLNFFDTANGYGGKKNEGWTEQIIGRWLAQGGGRRERIVLATKVYGGMGEGPNDRGLSARQIRAACDASLRRLQTDHLDLYQMHHVDRTTPWEEIWQAFEQLVQSGKILYVGSSNFAAWHIVTANQVAARRNFLGLVSEQSKYSLATRGAELEVLPACRHYGVGVIAYSPLEGGLLGGVAKGDGVRRTSEGGQKRLGKIGAQVQQYEALCRELGHEPAHVALAWILQNPALTAPILGPRTLEQLTGALPALELKLSPEIVAKLDALWPIAIPNTGKESPEAYAW